MPQLNAVRSVAHRADEAVVDEVVVEERRAHRRVHEAIRDHWHELAVEYRAEKLNKRRPFERYLKRVRGLCGGVSVCLHSAIIHFDCTLFSIVHP